MTKELDDLLRTDLTALCAGQTKLLSALDRLKLKTLFDLLLHLPLSYQDRTRITPIAATIAEQSALIEGVIQSSTLSQGRRPVLRCRVVDASGGMDLIFFRFNRGYAERLSQLGSRLRCFAKVGLNSRNFTKMMLHPECHWLPHSLDSTESPPLDKYLTAIYPATRGLPMVALRQLVADSLALLPPEEGVDSLLPPTVLRQYELPDLLKSLRCLHQPLPDEVLLSKKAPELIASATSRAERSVYVARLAMEELVAHQLSLLRGRHRLQTKPAPAMPPGGELIDRLMASLPFNLTGAQRRVVDEIAVDLASTRPMLRLLHGDVGSGKTIVAAIAALQAVACGYQVAFMAPTELLARQHHQNLTAWFEPLGLQLAFLAAKQPAKVRRDILSQIANGEAAVIIGTHALFQKAVKFARLGLLIIDEQHRFGVVQRLSLYQKASIDGQAPHQLIMSATPIPRTLAMAGYADLDLSTLDEMPPGRQAVVTTLLNNEQRERLLERVQLACQQGRQVYWVCPLIAESEHLQCEAAESSWQKLTERLPDLSIGLLHSRVPLEEKLAIMSRFKSGAVQLLVATTVIEVGVDVANASLMVIENAERLGLSQLHQLRGRVGRGQIESYCVLLYQAPLSQLARQRLDIMRQYSDGFAIAEYDLNLRGPGDVLGTRQAGLAQWRLASCPRDRDLLQQAQIIARFILMQYPALVDALIARWLAENKYYLQT